MSILKELTSIKVWESYLDEQKSQGHLSEEEEQKLREYLTIRSYAPIDTFSLPQKKQLNKMGTGKKRIVYTFSEDENMILKVMTWLLRRYDGYFSENCYAFRFGQGAGRAVRTLKAVPDISKKYSCKLDIKNYFNSIDIAILLPKLKRLLWDDETLYFFLEELLTQDACVWQGEILQEKRGVMAGTPVAGFLANLYLNELDAYFEQRRIPYARYSDDIIFFTDTKEEREKLKKIVCETLNSYHLELNPDKEKLSAPGEKWEYLGIAYQAGEIDLSAAALDKMKGKIRRKARALYRWKCRRQVADIQVMGVMNRVFNKKYFHNPVQSEMTWVRWYFPLLTKTEGLKELDDYMQQYLRYLCTGKHGTGNYKVTYNQMKESGYRNLVHEYYLYRNTPETYFALE